MNYFRLFMWRPTSAVRHYTSWFTVRIVSSFRHASSQSSRVFTICLQNQFMVWLLIYGMYGVRRSWGGWWCSVKRNSSNFLPHLVNGHTEYDITSNFRSAFIEVRKPAENAASDGFGSNFSDAAFCLPHQMVGILLLLDAYNGSQVDLSSSTHYINDYFRIIVAFKSHIRCMGVQKHFRKK